jgi:hypothetical protein
MFSLCNIRINYATMWLCVEFFLFNYTLRLQVFPFGEDLDGAFNSTTFYLPHHHLLAHQPLSIVR